VPADRLQKHPGRVIAVVARRSDCNGLGIDLERTGRLQPEQWPVFMTGGELDRLSLCSFDQRGAIAHGLWSAKEASMKALCQPLEPQAIEIQMFEDGRSFTAQCRVSLDAGHEDKVTLSGSLAHMDVWVLALVIR
jgi:4'-phosphopantetheinyl transferase EntD